MESFQFTIKQCGLHTLLGKNSAQQDNARINLVVRSVRVCLVRIRELSVNSAMNVNYNKLRSEYDQQRVPNNNNSHCVVERWTNYSYRSFPLMTSFMRA